MDELEKRHSIMEGALNESRKFVSVGYEEAMEQVEKKELEAEASRKQLEVSSKQMLKNI